MLPGSARPLSTGVQLVSAPATSRKTRIPPACGSAAKCFRYTQSRCQVPGSQFRQESGVTVCGSVTGCSPESSNPGSVLPAVAGPNNHPVLNGTICIATSHPDHRGTTTPAATLGAFIPRALIPVGSDCNVPCARQWRVKSDPLGQ